MARLLAVLAACLFVVFVITGCAAARIGPANPLDLSTQHDVGTGADVDKVDRSHRLLLDVSKYDEQGVLSADGVAPLMNMMSLANSNQQNKEVGVLEAKEGKEDDSLTIVPIPLGVGPGPQMVMEVPNMKSQGPLIMGGPMPGTFRGDVLGSPDDVDPAAVLMALHLADRLAANAMGPREVPGGSGPMSRGGPRPMMFASMDPEQDVLPRPLGPQNLGGPQPTLAVNLDPRENVLPKRQGVPSAMMQGRGPMQAGPFPVPNPTQALGDDSIPVAVTKTVVVTMEPLDELGQPPMWVQAMSRPPKDAVGMYGLDSRPLLVAMDEEEDNVTTTSNMTLSGNSTMKVTRQDDHPTSTGYQPADCRCSSNGVSGPVQGLPSGCLPYVMGDGVMRNYCYVVAGTSCHRATPSRAKEGAAWRPCIPTGDAAMPPEDGSSGLKGTLPINISTRVIPTPNGVMELTRGGGETEAGTVQMRGFSVTGGGPLPFAFPG